MFDFPLVAGDKQSVLIRPNTVLLSEKLIDKIFDHEGKDYDQFVGKAITLWTDSMPYKIEGVLKNIPENSHLAISNAYFLPYINQSIGKRRNMILHNLIFGIMYN